jgi:hypothetical protein
MNRPLVFGGIGTLIVAFWYYRKRAAAAQAATQNPNASTDNNIGSLINSSGYSGNTGQTGDTYTANDRYTQYQGYLSQGGTSSNQTFDQYLTASQGQSLPLSS